MIRIRVERRELHGSRLNASWSLDLDGIQTHEFNALDTATSFNLGLYRFFEA
jgi:hypothetical protein